MPASAAFGKGGDGAVPAALPATLPAALPVRLLPWPSCVCEREKASALVFCCIRALPPLDSLSAFKQNLQLNCCPATCAQFKLPHCGASRGRTSG